MGLTQPLSILAPTAPAFRPSRRKALALGCLSLMVGLVSAASTGCMKMTHLSSGGYVVSPTARTGASAVVYKDSLFLIGGQTIDEHGSDGGSFLKSVMKANFQPDGSLSPWTEQPSLAFPRGYAAALNYKDSIYLVGGYKDNNPGTSGVFSEILRANVQTDGSLSAWASVMSTGQAMGNARGGAAIVGDSLYVVGGISGGSSPLDTIVRYPMQDDGTLSLPVTVGRLNSARNRFALIGTDKELYAIGGYKGGFPYSYDDSVERVMWTAGSVIPLLETEVKMEARRGGHTAERIGKQILVVGGYDGGQYLDRIDLGTLNDAGQVVSWKQIGKLKAPRANHATAIHGGKLYVLGGGNKAGLVSDVETLDLAALGVTL